MSSGERHSTEVFSDYYDEVLNTLGFPGGSVVKNLSAKQEMLAQPLGWEDPLEKEVATNSSILAWKFSWTEEADGL